MQLLLYYHIYNLPSNLYKTKRQPNYSCLLVYLFILQIRAVFLITLCQSISIFIIKHKKCIVKFKNTPPNPMTYPNRICRLYEIFLKVSDHMDVFIRTIVFPFFIVQIIHYFSWKSMQTDDNQCKPLILCSNNDIITIYKSIILEA